jgi:hypothetical protein
MNNTNYLLYILAEEFPEIQINDLYTASLHIKQLQMEANVHYLEEGYEKLEEVVVASLKKCHKLKTGNGL